MWTSSPASGLELISAVQWVQHIISCNTWGSYCKSRSALIVASTKAMQVALCCSNIREPIVSVMSDPSAEDYKSFSYMLLFTLGYIDSNEIWLNCWERWNQKTWRCVCRLTTFPSITLKFRLMANRTTEKAKCYAKRDEETYCWELWFGALPSAQPLAPSLAAKKYSSARVLWYQITMSHI